MKKMFTAILAAAALSLCSFTNGSYTDTNVSRIGEAVASDEMLSAEGVLRNGIENAVISDVYYVKPDQLASVKSFEDIDAVSSTVRVFSGSETADLKKTGDKWEVIGSSTASKEGVQDAENRFTMLKAACESKSPFRTVEIPQYAGLLCIIKESSGGLTLTPVAGREDLMELKTGTEYKLSEAAASLAKSFSSGNTDTARNTENGGAANNAPATGTSSENNILLIVCASAAVLVILSLFFAAKGKRSRS